MKNLYIPIIAFIGMSYTISAQQFALASKRYTSEIDSESKIFFKKISSTLPGENEPAAKKSKNEIKGDKFYFIYSYNEAIEAYSSEDQLTTDGQRKLAISYYKMHKDTSSETAYLKLFTMKDGNNSEDYFNYSMVLKSVKKYEEAGKWMDKFVEQTPQDLRAIDYKANKASLPLLLENNAKYKINNLNINSDAQDFGTSYYKNKIVFASSRTTKSMPKTSYRNGKPYLNIYVADVDGDQLKDPENFNKSFNGNMNEGPASFNKEGTFMAYSKNNYTLTKKELIVNIEIYFSTYDKEKDKWSEPESFVLNNKDYSVGQPSLSEDGKTMYFTCNKPGGFGGADLYKVTRDDAGTWGNSTNLGNTINTEGNEVFPFYQEEKGILFFASNGHFGLGGLDIFSSTIKGSVFGKATNLGAPLNSSSDDFSILMDSSLTKGYFSSNRVGGSSDDDIYSVKFILNKKINGHAKDKNEKYLASTFITLLNDKDYVIDTVTTKSDGAFSFNVESDKDFKLTGEKEKYDDGSNAFSTYGSELIVKSDVTLLLTPKKEEIVQAKKEDIVPVKKEKTVAEKIKVNEDLGKIVGFKPIYFDFHEYKIRASAETELNKIVNVLNEYPSMSLQLNAHTDCRSSNAYNQRLSNRRAKSSADYLKSRIKNPERIHAKGYGETKLINACSCDMVDAGNCTEEDHQANRRTEFIIIKK
ncbi:OmpA family protein [Aurantibacillus circumpalustris]|uniref:OmpA family protein n=1 Tax=Aurantibacillus circumpalustris TaxID=3036359 RepID=UPI00295B744D|nr:OmpA family protein [Aurantibacillus circumpalustris]